MADGSQVRHGRSRQTPLDLGQETYRTLDLLCQLSEGEFLMLAQIVDQGRQGGKFFLWCHEIYVKKFHENLQEIFHAGNGGTPSV